MTESADLCSIAAPVDGRNFVEVRAREPGTPLAALDRDQLLTLFKAHGALLLQDFALTLEAFNAMTSQYCSGFVWNESGGRALVSADGRTQTVNIGHEAFPLHPELSREPWQPDIAWFACVRPPRQGGETLLCDGIAIVDALRPELRSALEPRSLKYKLVVAREECERALGIRSPDERALARLSERTPFQFTLEHGRYFRSFLVPFFHKPLFSTRRAFGSFLLFARYYQRIRDYPTFEDETPVPDEICDEIKAVSDRLTVPVHWRANDLLMVDNTRFMHGRNAVVDPGERVIWTQFGYASFVPISAEQLRRHPWRRGAAAAATAPS